MQGTVSGDATSSTAPTVVSGLAAIEARVTELEEKAARISDLMIGPEACDDAPSQVLGGLVDVTESLANRLMRLCARFTMIHDKLNGGSV
jgi:hypothetical protein